MIPDYGLTGIFFDMDDNRFHGKDERVGVTSFYEGGRVHVPGHAGSGRKMNDPMWNLLQAAGVMFIPKRRER